MAATLWAELWQDFLFQNLDEIQTPLPGDVVTAIWSFVGEGATSRFCVVAVLFWGREDIVEFWKRSGISGGKCVELFRKDGAT